MTKICVQCKQNPGNVSGMANGEWHEGVCRNCFNIIQSGQSVSAGHAEYNRQRDFEDMQSDIAQPRTKDGKPSTDFIRMYPQQASKLFTDKELRDNS